MKYDFEKGDKVRVLFKKELFEKGTYGYEHRGRARGITGAGAAAAAAAVASRNRNEHREFTLHLREKIQKWVSQSPIFPTTDIVALLH